MILSNNDTPPYFHFGFGKTVKNIHAGVSFSVWQDTIYNDQFVMDLVADGATVVKHSFNHYTLTYSTPGTYTFIGQVYQKYVKNTNVNSNIITIIVE